MKNTEIHIIQSNGSQREVDYIELNQLKKDILWVYDENFNQINAAFVPSYSFQLNYWEYLTLNKSKFNNSEDYEFYKIGSLIIILCQCVEYIDVASGDQKVFKKQEIKIIKKYIQNFKPLDESEELLKTKILLGLTIANSITDEQFLNSEFEHILNDEFYTNLNAIGNDFISAYYDQKNKMKN